MLLRARRGKQLEVFTHPPEEQRAFGQTPQDGAVGVTAIHHEDQRPLQALGHGIYLLPQACQQGHRPGIEVIQTALLAVLRPLLRGCRTLGTHHRRGMFKGHRQAPGRAGSRVGHQRCGHLQETLGANEVTVEGRGERIASIGHPFGLGTSLTQQRIVHGQHQRLRRRQTREHLRQHIAKEAGDIPAIGGEQTVVRRPVDKLIPAGTQDVAEGVATQA